MTRQLRKGGIGPLRKFENKNYFTLDNSSKYGHITFKFVGYVFLMGCYNIFQKIGLF